MSGLRNPRRTFRVPPDLAGERLDKVLVVFLGGELSRTRIQELIQDGAVSVDGRLAERPAESLEAGQELALREVPRSRLRAGGSPGTELVVLHEDEHLAVIDKPAGTLSHPTSVVVGGTVSELAALRWGELPDPQGEDRPGIVHRLDADTSGLMVLARSELAGAELVRAFRERAIEKGYLALVHGDPRFDSDWIETPIGRSRLRPDRMRVLEEGGRPASTFYRVRERLRDRGQPGFALLECWPKTGRTHQVRVHLSSIGHPLVGDRVYPGRVRRPLPAEVPPLARHLLHAHALRFTHPVSRESLSFESQLPEDFERWVEWLRGR